MQRVTGKPELMRKINITLIYKTLIELRTATRAEIVGKTQISTTTVRALLEELLEKGEIKELDLDESSGGRRAQRYTLSSKRNLALSLYLKENKIIYQICDLLGNLVQTGAEKIAGENITLCVIQFIEKCVSKWAICAIGMGVPGVVEGGRYYSYYRNNSLNQFVINTIGEQVRIHFHLPVILENDLNSIAFGFAINYSMNHPKCELSKINMAYIYFDKNCAAAGLIVDGRIVHGARQFAGELGFIPMESGRTADELLQSLQQSKERADAVARMITIVNCVTNPSLVVIGGEWAEEGRMDVGVVMQLMDTYIADIVKPKIMVSGDCKKEYLMGLSYLTIEMLIPNLPLSNILSDPELEI